jgi:hypothetical protein
MCSAFKRMRHLGNWFPMTEKSPLYWTEQCVCLNRFSAKDRDNRVYEWCMNYCTGYYDTILFIISCTIIYSPFLKLNNQNIKVTDKTLTIINLSKNGLS